MALTQHQSSSWLAVPRGSACPWRVMFLGQGPLAERALARLLDLPEEADLAVSVVCSNPNGHGTWWGTARICDMARRHGLRFVPNTKRNDALLARSGAELSINCLISVGHPWILPEPLLRPGGGGAAFNLHNGPLPEFGGFNAASHAILEGASWFGPTLHWMEPAADAGPVAFRANFEVPRDATARSLHDLTCQTSEALFAHLVDHLVERRLPPRVPLAGPPRLYSRRSLSEHREIVDISNEVEVDRKSRAFWFPPFEPAFCCPNGKKYYILPAAAISDIATTSWTPVRSWTCGETP